MNLTITACGIESNCGDTLLEVVSSSYYDCSSYGKFSLLLALTIFSAYVIGIIKTHFSSILYHSNLLGFWKFPGFSKFPRTSLFPTGANAGSKLMFITLWLVLFLL